MEGRDKNGSTSTIKKLVGRLRGSSVSSQGSGSRSRRASPSPVSQGILETWNAAYDSLADDPSCAGLVVAYETIISNELPDRLKMGGLNSSFRGKTADERLELLTAIASAGLERRRGSDTSQADDLAKKILDQARHYAQATMAQHAAAAIAWTGFCTLTPLLLDAIVQRHSFRSGLVHIVGRMPWYTNLSQILAGSSWETETQFRERHGTTRDRVIKLQRRVLELEMNCVCATASAWNAAAKNVVRWATMDQLVRSVVELDEQLVGVVRAHCTARVQDSLLVHYRDCDVSAPGPGHEANGGAGGAFANNGPGGRSSSIGGIC